MIHIVSPIRPLISAAAYVFPYELVPVVKGESTFRKARTDMNLAKRVVKECGLSCLPFAADSVFRVRAGLLALTVDKVCHLFYSAYGNTAYPVEVGDTRQAVVNHYCPVIARLLGGVTLATLSGRGLATWRTVSSGGFRTSMEEYLDAFVYLR